MRSTQGLRVISVLCSGIKCAFTPLEYFLAGIQPSLMKNIGVEVEHKGSVIAVQLLPSMVRPHRTMTSLNAPLRR